MRRVVVGLILGAIAGATVPSLAATVMQGNTYLLGWNVLVDGQTICSDPFVWEVTKELECD